jgi:hypothetical protein
MAAASSRGIGRNKNLEIGEFGEEGVAQTPAANCVLMAEKPDLEQGLVVCMELAGGRFRAIAGEETRHSAYPSSSLEPSGPSLLSHASPPGLLWQR